MSVAREMMMRRVNVIGSSCAGKSTFARRLAGAMGSPVVELDTLHWEPGWVEAPTEVFLERVAAATQGTGWVVDGNYSVSRPVFWPRVDTVVWLDFSFSLVLWRSLTRTWRRIVRNETCCNGNRESVWRTLSPDSIVWWVIRTHGPRRREFRKLLPELAARGVEVVILKTAAEAERWLGDVRRLTAQP
jgi:adenylate kinase family enzyme